MLAELSRFPYRLGSEGWRFDINRVGNWILEGVQFRDQNVIQAGVLTIACGFVFINLAVDMLYVLIDPRIRHA